MSSLALITDLQLGDPAALPAGFPALLRRWLEAMAARQPTDSVDAAAHDDWPDVCASLGGDGEAYARLVRRYQDAVAAVMWRFTRDPGQWEELVHDVFVEAYFSLPRYRGDAPLVHWLRKIAVRVGYRWWKQQARRKARTPLSLHAHDVHAPTGAQTAREAGQLVHELLGRMAPRDRLVLTLIYLQGCSVAETAELTGWSQTMVKVQAHRARGRLAKLFRQWEGEP